MAPQPDEDVVQEEEVCDYCGETCDSTQDELNSLTCTFDSCQAYTYHQHCIEAFLKSKRLDKQRKTGFPCPRGNGKATQSGRPCPGRITKSHPIHARKETSKKRRKGCATDKPPHVSASPAVSGATKGDVEAKGFGKKLATEKTSSSKESIAGKGSITAVKKDSSKLAPKLAPAKQACAVKKSESLPISIVRNGPVWAPQETMMSAVESVSNLSLKSSMSLKKGFGLLKCTTKGVKQELSATNPVLQDGAHEVEDANSKNRSNLSYSQALTVGIFTDSSSTSDAASVSVQEEEAPLLATAVTSKISLAKVKTLKDDGRAASRSQIDTCKVMQANRELLQSDRSKHEPIVGLEKETLAGPGARPWSSLLKPVKEELLMKPQMEVKGSPPPLPSAAPAESRSSLSSCVSSPHPPSTDDSLDSSAVLFETGSSSFGFEDTTSECYPSSPCSDFPSILPPADSTASKPDFLIHDFCEQDVLEVDHHSSSCPISQGCVALIHEHKVQLLANQLAGCGFDLTSAARAVRVHGSDLSACVDCCLHLSQVSAFTSQPLHGGCHHHDQSAELSHSLDVQHELRLIAEIIASGSISSQDMESTLLAFGGNVEALVEAMLLSSQQVGFKSSLMVAAEDDWEESSLLNLEELAASIVACVLDDDDDDHEDSSYGSMFSRIHTEHYGRVAIDQSML